MSNIKIKSMHVQNFKGVSDLDISFGETTEITGQNASGKTTIADAYSWVVFNKTLEGSEKFLIRPLDLEGNPIHNIDIEVTLTLDIDGKEAVIRKVQREKWVKKRGESESELKGSANSYFINEVPKTEAEFKEFVSAYADLETLRRVTGINAFIDLKPDDRRSLLVELSGDVSDEEMLDSDPEKWDVIRHDVLEVGVDDAKARAKRLLASLNTRQKELPVRIDEAKRAVQDVPDIGTINAKITEIEAEIEQKKQVQVDLEKSSSESALLNKKLDIKSQMDKIERAEASALQKKSDELRLFALEARARFDTAFTRNASAKADRKETELKLERAKADFSAEETKYKEAKGREFDSKATICKSCGQILPKGKVDAIMQNFSACRLEDMNQAAAKGKELKATIESLTKELAEKVDIEKQSFMDSENFRIAAVEAMARYDAFNSKPDLSHNEEYANLMAELHSVDEQLLLSKTADSDITKIKSEIQMLQKDKAFAEGMILDAQRIERSNNDVEDRIEELTVEQRKVGQQIALTERLIMCLEEFSIAKSKKLSENVNKLFKLANFELFEYQVNGGIRPICEISYQGVKYGSLNSGHQIVMGLDIIRTLQEHYGIVAPVWVDNAESVNDFNLPEMPGQLILLKVTEEEKLNVRAAS